MTLCSFIIPHVSLVLESAEKLSSFACPVGVKVCIHPGDSKIKDAKQESAFLEKKPAKNIVESSKDDVGCKLNNSYLPVSEQGGILPIITQWAMSRTKQWTVVQATITFLDMKMGGWEVELDATLGTEVVCSSGVFPCSIFTNPVNILDNCNKWPSGSARFFMRDHQNQGNGLRALVLILSLTQMPKVIFHHLQWMICGSLWNSHHIINPLSKSDAS